MTILPSPGRYPRFFFKSGSPDVPTPHLGLEKSASERNAVRINSYAEEALKNLIPLCYWQVFLDMGEQKKWRRRYLLGVLDILVWFLCNRLNDQACS
jgi:hypothetical protein